MPGFDLAAVLGNPAFRALIVAGVEITLAIFVCSWLLGMSLALVLMVIRLTPSRFGERFVAAYVSYHRNVPTLVQLMLWYFGISTLLPDSAAGMVLRS